jgi:chitinase
MTNRKHVLSIIFACLLTLGSIPLFGVSSALAAEQYDAVTDTVDTHGIVSQTPLPLAAAGAVHMATAQIAAPTFSPSGGTYTSSQKVTISCSTSGVTIRYTTYGGEPTAASPQYTAPIPVVITTTLKAKAFRYDMITSNTASATYTIGNIVATPIFSPAEGTYTSPQSVTISSSTSGATIRYTTNGSEPTASSMLYTAPLSVSATTTLKAKAFKSGVADSSTSSATYTIGNIVATPTFSPAGGAYTSHQNVTLHCSTSGAIIRYTTYGGEPTAASPQYNGPIPIIITTTLKAKAFKWNMTDSSTASATYTIE